MSAPLRVAIVGCGIGKSHAAAYRNLAGKFDVVALCDTNEERARILAEQASVQRVTTRLADVLAMPDVDVVDLCTPPSLHYQQVLDVLAAGKHCICEKPLVGSLREVDALAAAEKTSGKRMMPVFQYRFGQGAQQLYHLCDLGLTGQPYVATIEMHWRRRADYYATPWRGKWATDLGGVLNGLTIHMLDVAMQVLGRARRVSAFVATKVNPIEVDDCASAILEMESGALLSVSATLGSATQITRQRFVFANLTAESEAPLPYASSSRPWTFAGDTPELDEQVQQALRTFEPGPERFEGQFLGFHAALCDGAPLPVSLQDSRRAIELVTAIYRSVHAGRAVSLPLRKDAWYNGWRPFVERKHG